MTTTQIVIILAGVLHVFFETGINFLNIKSILKKKKSQPEKTKDLMNEDQWGKTSDYAVGKAKLSILQDVLGFFL